MGWGRMLLMGKMSGSNSTSAIRDDLTSALTPALSPEEREVIVAALRKF